MPVHKSKPDRSNEWITVIQPKTSFIRINFKEIWQYRDLLRMFVKRDVITVYKQTILGPVWYIVQPILTTAIYMLIFGKIAKLSTDGMPQILFYLGGIVIWNYFAESFNTTSKTFIENASIFGKVYFPRLIMPLAKITSGLIKFLIQFSFFLVVYTYFLIGDHGLTPNWTLILVPLYILLMALIGLGTGILFTSMTTRYRDLNFLLSFGVQLLMYATPVIYPVSIIPAKYRIIIMLNPLTSIVEGFKYAFMGVGHFSWPGLLYSAGFTLVILFTGILVFHKTQRNFIDTI